MQKFTKTEIKWIISALSYKSAKLQNALVSPLNKISRELIKLELENLNSVMDRLEKTLNENDKRICIE